MVLDGQEAVLFGEDERILLNAHRILRSDLSGLKPLPRFPEPSGNKVHWEHVLEEMSWLAKDFVRERKWRHSTGRKYSGVAAQKALIRRRRHDFMDTARAQQSRRLAACMAREAVSFWNKIHKLARFKKEFSVETEQKAELECQLDKLLLKTEEYSLKLAATLSMVEQKNEEDVLGRHDQGEGKESRQQGTTHDQMTREDRHRDEELQGDYIPNKGEEWDDLESFEEQMRREAEDKVDNELELQQLREEAELSVEELIERHKLLDRHKLLEQAQSCEDESLHQHKERPAAHVQPQTAFQIPSILKHELRDYQKFGLQWLLGCHRTGVNGILADEMGLGKTIQTISLLAHLACEQGVWGPHLIIVPTSVMVNWEVEFKKWCPALKIITYFGSQKERKMQRMGWSKPNSFHVCITTYRLVVQDQTIFRRKRWHYLILDEAHMIKNWRSQRWQTILTFESAHRLLITGTPLQNDVMELWALLHFLMPDLFQSHSEFKSWFSNPLLGMAEGKIAIDHGLTSRLHSVLRPFILRRLKIDVETSLPSKIEHVVRCRLSRRQKRLYDEYMSSNDTVKILGSSNVMGVMNCLMQLRKVCNHPDLFAGRSIISAYDMPCEIFMKFPGSCTKILRSDHLLRPVYPVSSVDRRLTHVDILSCGTLGADEFVTKQLRQVRIMQLQQKYCRNPSTASQLFHVSSSRFHAIETVAMSVSDKVTQANHHTLLEFEQVVKMDQVLKFRFRIPKVRARTPIGCVVHNRTWNENVTFFNQLLKPLRDLVIRGHIVFPDARLVQFDCGKLQALAPLLRVLKSGGHKVVIFTQMTKVLDILERFLNLYSYSYVRLDGTTKPEQRQILMQRFNADQRLFAFILSTRSGGFGINLTGADTVIFYDSDWNPAVDAQAQDRCHRIGQTREVNIYRLISENTVEENVFKKALQKRELDELAIQKGHFNLNALEGIELDEKTDAPNDKRKTQSAQEPTVFDQLQALLTPVEKYALRFADDSNEEHVLLEKRGYEAVFTR